MDRTQVIAKIKAMLKLQESTDFDGEASAAASMIDKLCAKYGVTLGEAKEAIVLEEVFSVYKKIDHSYATLLNAVANFYDAKAFVKRAETKEYRVMGTEAQQIQTKLYFEYLYELMITECDKAYEGEKIISELTGSTVNRSFKFNFRKAFSLKVAERLSEMKKNEGRAHEDRDAVQKALSTVRFGRNIKMSSATGDGASVGLVAGSGASLNRQANGSSAVRQLTAA